MESRQKKEEPPRQAAPPVKKSTDNYNDSFAVNQTNFSGAPIVLDCPGYEASDFGIFKIVRTVDSEGKPREERKKVSSQPILPVEIFKNASDRSRKIKVAYVCDDRWESYIIPADKLFHSRSFVSYALYGIDVTDSTAKSLVEYLNRLVFENVDTIPVTNTVDRLGWLSLGGEDVQFAPYAENLRFDGLDSFESLFQAVNEKGNRDAWLDMMNSVRQQSLVARLAIDASFASVLLEPLGRQSFVFHLWGITGCGKTTLLQAAASVWGNPSTDGLLLSLNQTQNYMLQAAAFLRNLPFCADELQQLKKRRIDLDTLVMTLTEGVDRGRLTKDSKAVKTRTFRNIFLFTGEEPLSNDRSFGGVKNRCIEVQCISHLFDDFGAIAKCFSKNYGWGGKLFIEKASEMLSDGSLNTLIENFEKGLSNLTDSDGKQISALSVILAADSIVSSLFFGETPLTCEDVVQFLKTQDEIDPAERAYSFIMSTIAENEFHFEKDAKTERWGSYKPTYIGISIKKLKEILAAAGFSFDAVKHAWVDKKYIEYNSDKKQFTFTERHGGLAFETVRFFLRDNEEDEEMAKPQVNAEDIPCPKTGVDIRVVPRVESQNAVERAKTPTYEHKVEDEPVAPQLAIQPPIFEKVPDELVDELADTYYSTQNKDNETYPLVEDFD